MPQVELLPYQEEMDDRPSHYEVDIFLKEAVDWRCSGYGRWHSENITGELRKLSSEERIKNIGITNRESLAKAISEASGDGSIHHLQLVNPSLLGLTLLQVTLFFTSPLRKESIECSF